MEELNEQQRQDIIRKRQQMFERMGVANAGKMITESAVANAPAGSMAAKLAAIRGGAAKGEFNKFLSATGKNAPSGAGEFQGIPEPSKRKSPSQTKESVKPEYSQRVEEFSAPAQTNQELSAIDAMFGGGEAPTRINMGGNTAYQTPAQELDIDSMDMPTFNPQIALQKAKEKAARNQQQQQQQQVESPYLKFASDTPPIGSEQFEDIGQSQTGINVNQLQKMMETIAKGVAEKTIRSVLNEFTNQQKEGSTQNSNKLFFEYYTKDKTVVKTTDGKFYRLTEVVPRKK